MKEYNIYIDDNYIGHAYPIEDPICITTNTLWDIYADSGYGVGWTIREGSFKPIQDPQDFESKKYSDISKDTRHLMYLYADEQISKCDNYILLDIETEKYTRLKLDWLQYKMDVRNTKNQEGYPLEVEYPEKPEVD